MELLHEDHNGLKTSHIENKTDGHSYMVESENGKYRRMIQFQDGPVPANGINGITNESLLAIVIHRTKVLDKKFGCNENKMAIEHMQKALDLFTERTMGRMERGVEGKEVE